ncbi:SAM-dependent DNA methyltransferase [Sulfitobacter mediterraneus]|uniref:type I restriction-modification system subunit M n=1 Tax=Sulfitobacter mediterraneus TaxID=83219 RepID=UPI001931685B|nr:class I SAM-dependent DNA methyltransferase [Sulfitobacter mediterraneus]MBM1311901.1 SAM-dependent DNA methyltransferase [Sulfitobacter mediterraneus]MBM1315782.1 SAM-dependent DNA methyltransferase [Sulfitobacter mediterraneus]MBM1324144.1 SAM-dependent DNA methyltransferase [Sulfitobacter mediterraneus]MBM1328056.1 SAM-dependent DNA methyltransferase [Sulfitobacter mediterraneus]MBM1399404.1 SAM-dependent DNA methyltransferase [Sulfitobacter mediterraneus]
MVTGELKKKIDALWTEFWTGGITNPLTVIEQITFLIFVRLLDVNEARDENRLKRSGVEFKRRFNADEQELRWSQFRHLGADEMLPLVRDRVFPHFRKASVGTTFAEFMKDAQLMIQKPSLLVKAVNMINDLPLTAGDTKGDLYEYLLGKLTTAGINGQFRTPRHIIRLMVDMLEPKPTDVISDPSCGTGGFLVETMNYLLENHTSPEAVMEETDPDTGKTEKTFTGDLLEDHWAHIRNDMFHGFDFDATMLRIAAMNMMLHGVDNPDIHYQDTLSNSFPERFPKSASEGFDIVLANPPFKGSLDFEDVHAGLLRQVKTKKTELLFLVLILRMLKTGGRSATIVPDGVLFGSSTAHVALRKLLVDHNQLEAVISLPSGVFKPYAGVSTGILVFTKGGRTDDVFFYDVEADGYSLDDKRDPIEANDLPDCITAWRDRDPKRYTDRKQKAFFVPADDIREANYDLSLSRYKERVYEEQDYDPPKDILERMNKLNAAIAKDLADLEGMLG